jgi:hypothetical protein
VWVWQTHRHAIIILWVRQTHRHLVSSTNTPTCYHHLVSSTDTSASCEFDKHTDMLSSSCEFDRHIDIFWVRQTHRHLSSTDTSHRMSAMTQHANSIFFCNDFARWLQKMIASTRMRSTEIQRIDMLSSCEFDRHIGMLSSCEFDRHIDGYHSLVSSTDT